MRSRDLLLLLGGLALAASFSILLLTGTAEVAQSQELTPAHAEAPAGPADLRPTAAESDFHKNEAVVADPNDGRAKTDTSGWTTGVIVGDVSLSTTVLDKIKSLSVVVEEQRSALSSDGKPPWHHLEPVKMGDGGTPTFRVADIPFSEYGYVVRLYSPGLNGGRHTVQITKEHPYENSVVLSLTPGVPFSVLLRDQDQNPVVKTDVILEPIGDRDRQVARGPTDNFGSVVFDNMIAGDYRVYIGDAAQPRIPPLEITVQPAGHTFQNGSVQSQGQTIVVPRGTQVPVFVHDSFGYGLPDVKIKMQATDRTQLVILEGVTDTTGHCTFPYVQPGIWQIDAFKTGYDRRTTRLDFKDGDVVAEQGLGLVRLR